MAFPKYQTKEVLNKILNSAETAIQVDIVAGAEYAEDSGHTSEDKGNFILGVRNDALAALGGTDGDYVPFQMNADGALFIDVAAGGILESAVDGLETLLTAANVDHAANEALLITIDADTNAIKGHVDGIETLITSTNSKIDTFDAVLDSILTKNTEIDAVLDTIDADTSTLAAAVSTQMQVDVVASLPAGSAAIGKLAANSGVDIGDVDVTSIIPATGATNLGKAIQSAQGSTDTGVAALAVRNDALADLSGADGDYTPLQVNKTGALNVTENTGYLGAIFEDGTENITSKKVIAIQFLEDTTFTTLTPVDSSYIGTASGNGDAIDTSNTFPQGMTIFGRWTGYRLASGTIVAYQGDW